MITHPQSESREIPICGFNAVRAVLRVHPDRVKRLFFTPAHGKHLGDHCRAMARQRKFYKQIEDAAELERLAGTVHHGGVVAVTEVPYPRRVSLTEVREWARNREPLLIMDRIGNAHNLGALIRSAAFFGLRRVVLSGDEDQAVPGAVFPHVFFHGHQR